MSLVCLCNNHVKTGNLIFPKFDILIVLLLGIIIRYIRSRLDSIPTISDKFSQSDGLIFLKFFINFANRLENRLVYIFKNT